MIRINLVRGLSPRRMAYMYVTISLASHYKSRIAMCAAGLAILFGGVAPSCCQEIKVVSPKGLANAEGDSSTNPDLPPFRYQQVFPASDFESLPEGRRLIVRFAKRPDADAVAPFTETWADVQIRMSITSAGPDDLSASFDDNIQSEQTLVYDGSLVLSTSNTGPAGGPKDFDLIWELQNPFLYDRDQGNLLVEWIATSGIATSGAALNDIFVSPITSVTNIGNPDAQSGILVGGFPMQFTFVPEPSTLVLAALGLVSLLAWRRKKHQRSRI